MVAAMKNRESPDLRHEWLELLVPELFQTEQSACEHPRVEADRLGDVPPAVALLAVADHATAAMRELVELMQRRDLPVSRSGQAAGHALSKLRDLALDVLISSEKSYRGTLIGMRHGVDLVELTGAVAREHGDGEFADWCDQWLERRRPLVEAAAHELAWFAANPERATDPARLDSPVSRGLHAFIRGCQHLAERLRRPPAERLQSAQH
jgi:hypothetical protein